MVTNVGPQASGFPLTTRSRNPSTRALLGLRESIPSLVLGDPVEVFRFLSCTFL